MNLRPGQDESFLFAGQMTGNLFDWVYGEDSDFVLVVGMEMRTMMRLSSLDEHPDDDAEGLISGIDGADR